MVILVKLAGNNNQTGGGVKHHLQVAAGGLLLSIRRIRTALIIVNPGRRFAARNTLECITGCQIVTLSYTSKLLELVEAAADDVPVPDVLVHRHFTVSYSDGDAEVTNFVQLIGL